MDWLIGFLLDWCWFIAALPVVALILLVVVLFVGSKGPYPEINVHKEEKTFIDSKSGNYRSFTIRFLISGLGRLLGSFLISLTGLPRYMYCHDLDRLTPYPDFGYR